MCGFEDYKLKCTESACTWCFPSMNCLWLAGFNSTQHIQHACNSRKGKASGPPDCNRSAKCMLDVERRRVICMSPVRTSSITSAIAIGPSVALSSELFHRKVKRLIHMGRSCSHEYSLAGQTLFPVWGCGRKRGHTPKQEKESGLRDYHEY